ncbi:MAG: hypothetical protein AB7G28_15175 [Pirellulales bacterium]
MSRINSLHFSVGIGALLAVLVAGCSNGDDPASALANANGTNVQRLSNLYFTFQSEHDWRGPRDEAEFKTFLHSIDSAKLERIGIDPNNIDALFISERDGQPFAIRYGVQGSVMGSAEPVVFEAAGDGNKRLVGFLNMTQREVDPAEYDALKSGQIPAAPPQRDSRP